MWGIESKLFEEEKASNKSSDNYTYYTKDLNRQKSVTKQDEIELFKECEQLNWQINLELFNSENGLELLDKQIKLFEEGKLNIWLMFYDLLELQGSNKNSVQRFKTFKEELKKWKEDYHKYKDVIQRELLNIRFETLFLIKSAETSCNKEAKRAINKLVKQKNKIVQSNLKLVIKMAKKYSIHFGFCDLIQEGNIGLIKGVDKFRWDKGYKLSTYVSHWIRQSINEALTTKSREIKLPGNVVNVLYKIRKLNGEMDTALMTIEEIAKRIEVPEDKVRYVLDINQEMLSIEANNNNSQSGNKETTLSEILEDDSPSNNFEVKTFEEERREFIAQFLQKHLSEREQFVIANRFGFGDNEAKTLEEIGKSLETAKGAAKRETVRQIEIKALEKLRQCEEFAELQQFLSLQMEH